MNKEKVLRIGFVADGGDAGGARTHILTLLRQMPEHRIECFFFSLGEGALSNTVEQLEKVHLTAYPLKSKADPRILKAIQKWSAENSLDVIHTHGLKANMYARLALYRSPVPIITTYHSHPLFDYRLLLNGIIFTWIDQLTLHRSNHFIAVSYEIATQLEKRGIDRDQITIIKNGVPAQSFDSREEASSRQTIRKQWDIPEEAIVVGSLGRLVKVKGYDEMLDLFKGCLDASTLPLYLLVIGGGEEKQALESKAKALGIHENIRWVGFQKNPYPYILACDLMLFTPRSEALGIALLECMTARRAVVSKKVGGIQELLLDRYNGRIRSKKEELIRAVLELSENPEQRKALAENGAQMANRFFTCERMAEKTAQLYRSIKKDRIHILDLPVDNLRKSEILPLAEEWLKQESCQQVITINLEMIARARQDSSFRKAIQEAELVIPDGISILKLAKSMGEFVSEKVAGVELGEALLSLAEKESKKVYFLGSTQATLTALKQKLGEKYPRLTIAGMHHGYFSEEEEKAMVAEIAASKADILFVGMGAGKQDCFIHRNKNKLMVRMAMGIGGSLDIWAGKLQRAPQWALKLNIEWLYRILSQPQLRLGRFLKSIPVMRKVLKDQKNQVQRLLISGYYGYGNIGDETILQTLTRDLHALSKKCKLQVSVLSANPHMTTTLADEVFSSHRFCLSTLIKELVRAKGVISGGGGLIQDVTSTKSPWYYLGIIALARCLRKKVFVYANGVGPLQYPFNRWLSKLILSMANPLTVRDEHSEKMLQSWGIHHCQLTADPIFSYHPTPIQDPYPNHQDFIAVSLGRSRETNAKIPFFANYLDELSRKTGKTCVFTPFYRAYDSRFSQKVMDYMSEPSMLIDTFLLPEEMFSLLSRASIGVGMRLHFLVFLSLLGKPLLPIVYDPKVEAFCGQLALPFAWTRGTSHQSMIDQMEAFVDYTRQPVSYKKALQQLSERNHLNQQFLEDFVCP